VCFCLRSVAVCIPDSEVLVHRCRLFAGMRVSQTPCYRPSHIGPSRRILGLETQETIVSSRTALKVDEEAQRRGEQRQKKKRLLAARSGLYARLAVQYGAIQEGRCKDINQTDINGLRYARISHFVPWDRLHYEGKWPHTSKVAQRHPSRLQVLSRLCIYLSHT
jgi:hypothetical protein